MEQIGDEDLVLKFRAGAGNPQTDPYLNELFRRHRQRVACWCLRLTGDRESAADLAQDVFVSAYRHLDSFRGDSKFSTWLYSIARNHCLNEMRARSTQPAGSYYGLQVDVPDQGESGPYARVERQSVLRLLGRMIEETLDEIEKRVFMLHYAEEVPLDEVTLRLGLTNPSGAKAYVVSGKRKLGRAFDRLKARHSHKGALL